MNNIEQIIANAQQQASTQTSEAPVQQAAGQDFQPSQQQPQQTQQYTQVEQVPQQQPQQTQHYNQVPQQSHNQMTMVPQQSNPMGNTQMDIPANLPPEIAMLVGQRVMSMETMASSDLQVGDWLKTSFHGMALGSKPTFILGSVDVEIEMTENTATGFMLCNMVRWTVQTPQGEQTNYVHTYDGVKGSDGQPWVNAVMTAYNHTTNPQKPNKPYPCVQLPMKLMHDITGPQDARDPQSPQVVYCKAGTLLGHTSAASGWKAWEAFHNDVKAAGLLGQRVIATVQNLPVQPQGSSYKWGVLQLTLKGPAPVTQQQPQA